MNRALVVLSATWLFVGVSLSTASYWVLTHWLPVAHEWLGPQVVHYTRPRWLRITIAVVTWLPWAPVLVLIALRRRFGPVVRPVAYAVGAASPCFALVSSVLVGPSIAN